jgi:hypothetical protein
MRTGSRPDDHPWLTPDAAQAIPANFRPPLLETPERRTTKVSDATAGRIIYRAEDRDPKASDGSLASLNVDVFWCQGDDKSSTRQALASEVAGTIATAARLGDPVSNSIIGRVGIRPLSAEVNLLGDYQVTSNVIRANSGDEKEASWAKAIGAASLTPLAQEEDRSTTPGYISVFICSDIEIVSNRALVYVQIADAGQETMARSVVKDVRGVAGVTVADSLDLEVKSSPDTTQVRYFHETDQPVAEAIAARTQGALGSDHATVKARYISGYEGKAAAGTIEVWLGKNEKPAAPTSTVATIAGKSAGDGDYTIVFKNLGDTPITIDPTLRCLGTDLGAEATTKPETYILQASSQRLVAPKGESAITFSYSGNAPVAFDTAVGARNFWTVDGSLTSKLGCIYGYDGGVSKFAIGKTEPLADLQTIVPKDFK